MTTTTKTTQRTTVSKQHDIATIFISTNKLLILFSDGGELDLETILDGDDPNVVKISGDSRTINSIIDVCLKARQLKGRIEIKINPTLTIKFK